MTTQCVKKCEHLANQKLNPLCLDSFYFPPFSYQHSGCAGNHLCLVHNIDLLLSKFRSRNRASVNARLMNLNMINIHQQGRCCSTLVSPVNQASKRRTLAVTPKPHAKTPGLRMKTHTPNPWSRVVANMSCSPSKAVEPWRF